MKKLLMIVGTGAVTAILFTFTACKKENYDDKYQPKGNYQPAGNYGNADVISKTATLSYTFDPSNNTYFSLINVPEITDQVLYLGTVQVFVNSITTGDPNWIALPVTISNNYIFFNVGKGKIEVASNSSVLTNYPYTVAKIVIIKPAGKLAHPNINYKNYEEIKKAFNLKD